MPSARPDTYRTDTMTDCSVGGSRHEAHCVNGRRLNPALCRQPATSVVICARRAASNGQRLALLNKERQRQTLHGTARKPTAHGIPCRRLLHLLSHPPLPYAPSHRSPSSRARSFSRSISTKTCSSDLDDSFSQLISLRELGLHQNRFCQLPLAICQLTRLRVLNMGYNQLERLPDDEMGSLVELRALQTQDCRWSITHCSHCAPWMTASASSRRSFVTQTRFQTSRQSPSCGHSSTAKATGVADFRGSEMGAVSRPMLAELSF